MAFLPSGQSCPLHGNNRELPQRAPPWYVGAARELWAKLCRLAASGFELSKSQRGAGVSRHITLPLGSSEGSMEQGAYPSKAEEEERGRMLLLLLQILSPQKEKVVHKIMAQDQSA